MYLQQVNEGYGDLSPTEMREGDTAVWAAGGLGS